MGEVNISMSIISKQHADSDPVGDGQEEPNKDPYLEKVKEGRGIADYFRGTAFDFSAWRFFLLKALKIVFGLASSVIITFILFVRPGILVK